MKIDNLLNALEGVKRTGPGKFLARCPAHNDRHASLAIKLADDDRILIHCFANCGTESVLAAVGMTFDDLFPDRQARDFDPTKPQSKPPRYFASELLRTALFEATIVTVALGRVLSGATLDGDDLRRVKLAMTAIDAIRREVSNVA